MKAEIITPYTGTGVMPENDPGDGYRPKVCDVYDIPSWADRTGHMALPSPDVMIVEVDRVEQSVLDLIEADSEYEVLWSE